MKYNINNYAQAAGVFACCPQESCFIVPFALEKWARIGYTDTCWNIDFGWEESI